MNRRLVLYSLLIGLCATLAGSFIKLEYCMAGDGYGIPAAIIHPSHEEWWLVPLSGESFAEGLAFDPLSLIINVVVSSLLAWPIARQLVRRRFTPAR
jgi:hypothetical protein